MKRYTTEHNYITSEDLLEKLGYRVYKPKLGSLGRELVKTGNRSVGWLKKQLDLMFKKVRKEAKKSYVL